MKIVFNIKEDDARNPGVIADCTATTRRLVGPTRTVRDYGVTGVALDHLHPARGAQELVQCSSLVDLRDAP